MPGDDNSRVGHAENGFATRQPVDYDKSDPTLDVMQYFEYGHLPPHMQAVSKMFAELAYRTATLPRCPQRTIALNKLLEAKDAAVRAAKK